MARELLDLLEEPLGVELLDSFYDPRVEHPAAVVQYGCVGDVMRQRMTERVLRLGEQACLVKELCGPKMRESATERLVRELGDRLEQRERYVLADDGGRLEQTFVLREEPVDARRQHRLDRGRNLDRLDRLRQPIPTALSHQRLRLHQRPDRLLQEERVATLDQQLLERYQPGVVAEERIQQLPRALGRERVQPQLAVGRLAAPGVLVLGTVVHEQQQACRAQALDQAVEQ